MKKLLIVLGIVLLLMGCCRYATVYERRPLSDQALASLVIDYNVGVERPNGSKCGGTLIDVGGNLRVLTARHCTQICVGSRPSMCVGPVQEKVIIIDGSNRYKANFERASNKYDLALYKIDGDPVVAIVDIADVLPRVGDMVVSAGCPRGVCDALSWGRVSKHNINESGWDHNLMQVDLNSTNGASGSGVFDFRASLVGVVVAGTRGLLMSAVPIGNVEEFLNE